MVKKIIFALMLLAGASYAEAALLPDGATIAVMDFGTHKGAATSDISLTSAEGASSDYIIERLVEDGRMIVMERSIMQEKLNKEKLKTTGIIDPDTATNRRDFGRFLHYIWKRCRRNRKRHRHGYDCRRRFASKR